MENYKADANLMIGDMMVTMTDDGDDDDVFISMLGTRKRLSLQAFKIKRVVFLRGRHLAPAQMTHARPR